MHTYSLALDFTTKPYVGSPYWPEMNQLIDVQKKSGLNRAKSDANRRKSLEEYLRANGMTLADYERLQADARRPFHTDQRGEIIIPSGRFMAFLVAANSEARAAFKACDPSQVHARIDATDFATGKTEADGVWMRFAVVTLGTGAKASNQRGLRMDPYIENFTAKGLITFDEETVDPPTLKNLITWGGQFVGIGASRKMGKGRFQLSEFALVREGDFLALAAE
jgi:hypothetical protein